MNALFLLLYGVLTITFLFILLKNKLNTLYYLPLFWMISEMLSVYFYEYDSDGTINMLTFLFVFYASIKIGFKVYLWNILLILFLIIALIQTPFEINYLSFGNRYLNLFNIYMILPISYFVIKDINEFDKINKILYKTLIITTIYIIVSSILKVGPNMYNTGLVYGLNWGQFYGPALIAVLLLSFNTKKTKSQYIFPILMILLVLFTFRRTAILIVVIFLLVYYLYSSKGKKLSYLFIVGVILLGFYLSLENIAGVKNSERAVVLSTDYDITREGRYYDIYGVLELIVSDKRILTGYELFNEYGQYGAKRDSRPIHVDIMRIFFGVGLLGVIPLLLALFNILIKGYKIKNEKNIRGIFIAIMAVFFVTLLTGGSLYISYSGIAFIYLGSIMQIYNNQKLTVEIS